MPKTQNTKYNLVNNLESKHSLLMKFGNFKSYYKRKFFYKKLYEKCGLKTSSRLFLIFSEFSVKRNLRRSVFRFGQISVVLLIRIY